MNNTEIHLQPSIDFGHLNVHGYQLLEVESSKLKEYLTDIATALGSPVPHRNGCDQFYTLRPSKTGYPNSLTSRFGVGMFPLHTDTAHWFRPARYVVLACVAPGRGARKTQLLHWDSLNLTNADCESIRNGVFQIVRGKQSFLSQIIDHRLGFIRVDFQCMVPFGNIARDAQLCVETAVQVSPKIEIDWAQGRILIIDNWRILHGRASSKEEDSDRELIRVLIEEIR